MKARTILLILMLLYAHGCYASAPFQGDQPETRADSEIDARLDLLFGQHVLYRKFFEEFQRAVAWGDVAKVAGMINYPMSLTIKGRKIILRSERDFVANYARIFSSELIATVRNQRYALLFTRDEGVMIGNGEIWFSGLCDDAACKYQKIKVTAFNLSDDPAANRASN